MNPSSVSHVYKNRILASLPADSIQRLAPHLKPETYPVKSVFHEAGQPVRTIYFLEDGLCSSVVPMKSGNQVEVGIIGREGFIGVAAMLDAASSVTRTFMQVGGHGFSVKAGTVHEQKVFNHADGLHPSMLRAIQAMLTQTSLTAACNRVHDLEPRLARWLLMCRDRLSDDRMPMTHEFLSIMLGTTRSSVTVAAGALQKSGLIEISRGHIEIQDLKGLEHASCECYSIVHKEYVRLGLL